MLTNSDIKKLKDVFATKADLKQLATKKVLEKMENRLQKSINRLTDVVDEKLTEHDNRLERIEKHLNLSPISN